METRSPAEFFHWARLINGKPAPASIWYVITKGTPAVFLALMVLVIGIATAFFHPIVGAIIVLSAFFIRGPALFTGWYGHCPACRAELWLAVPKDAPVQGHDYPTCKNRIILREGTFELAPSRKIV